MAEATETVKITFTRPVEYKEISFKAGVTADVAKATAERLIAEGHAKPATATKAEKAEK
jgi:hypothetical protein